MNYLGAPITLANLEQDIYIISTIQLKWLFTLPYGPKLSIASPNKIYTLSAIPPHSYNHISRKIISTAFGFDTPKSQPTAPNHLREDFAEFADRTGGPPRQAAKERLWQWDNEEPSRPKIRRCTHL